MPVYLVMTADNKREYVESAWLDETSAREAYNKLVPEYDDPDDSEANCVLLVKMIGSKRDVLEMSPDCGNG